MKELILLRGLPGSGKSTLGGIIAPEANVAADDYFTEYNSGTFDGTRIVEAHHYCQDITESYMVDEQPVIAVHNTFTRESEMKYYYALAAEYGYRVHSIIVENRAGSSSVHGVPPETIAKMANRFAIKLK